ncbi:MAG: DUF1778 domain-containing protein [Legionellales bacterium]|nr:DUF1778 domain-containing protein [Legionellales bacterium]
MSTSQTLRKSARLESRCTIQQKDIVLQAAFLSGLSVTDFTVNSVLEKAADVIKQQKILTLSLEDQKTFVNALLNPPEPNKALIQARNRYKKVVTAK